MMGKSEIGKNGTFLGLLRRTARDSECHESEMCGRLVLRNGARGPDPGTPADDAQTIDQLAARAIKHLTTNCRFAYKAGSYGDMEFGKNFGYSAVEGYFGETTGVDRTRKSRSTRKARTNSGRG